MRRTVAGSLYFLFAVIAGCGQSPTTGMPNPDLSTSAGAPDLLSDGTLLSDQIVALVDAPPMDARPGDAAPAPDAAMSDGTMATDLVAAIDATPMVDLTAAIPVDAAAPPDFAPACSPQSPPTCNGSSVKTCRSDGTGYDETPCPTGSTCAAGACTCVAGAIQCQGQSVQTCGMDGAFHTTITCPAGTTCRDGHCDDVRCADETSVSLIGLAFHAWPRHRHDNRSSAWSPAIVRDLPQLKWKVFVGGTNYDQQKGIASGPVVSAGNNVFVGAGELDGKQGQFYAFDALGKPIYTYPTSRLTGLSTPAVRSDGTAYVGSGDGSFFALRPDGTKLWSYKAGSSSDGHLLVLSDGTVIYPNDDDSIYAFTADGKLLWKTDPVTGPGEVDGGLSESCDGRVYAGGGNGWHAIDAKTGKSLWSVPATGMYQALSGTPVLTADGIMYGVDGGGKGYAIDPAGKVLWSRQLAAAGTTAPTHAGDALYVVENDGNLHALDAATGNERWSRPVGYQLTRSVGRIAGPAVDGNMRLYINSTDGNLYIFDTTGKQLAKIAISGVSRAQLFSDSVAIGGDGTLYVPGNDGTLYVLQ